MCFTLHALRPSYRRRRRRRRRRREGGVHACSKARQALTETKTINSGHLWRREEVAKERERERESERERERERERNVY